MQQSAIETAASFSGKFGVLALSDESIARHALYILELGFADRLAAELPLDISVDEASNGSATLDKVLRNGRRLVDEFAATSVILGCAGMAGHRRVAERELAVPVIEPAQAALKLAIEAA
jgi:Asp/Glu/hydantoin racemase